MARKYREFVIVDVDSHHYENESYREVFKYIESPVIRRAALESAERPGRSNLLNGQVGYQDIGGRHVGSVLGLGNMCASFGSASYTWFAGSLADRNEWNTVFLLAAGAMVVATLSWLLLDPTHPAVPDDEPAGAALAVE